jgi:hypothetical protein
MIAAEGRVITPQEEFTGRQRPNFLEAAIDEGARALAERRARRSVKTKDDS